MPASCRRFAIRLLPLLATLSLSPVVLTQTQQAPMSPSTKGPLPSPDATAKVTLDGKPVSIKYNAPSVRGRKIMGGLVPYGEVWRTGANPATTLTTAAHLRIGTLDVPAGTYTIYTLPNADTWMLIINRQTGQWGTIYDQAQDLGRTPMTSNPLANLQEVMSLSFENPHKNTAELHLKWETTDRYVTVTAE